MPNFGFVDPRKACCGVAAGRKRGSKFGEGL